MTLLHLADLHAMQQSNENIASIICILCGLVRKCAMAVTRREVVSTLDLACSTE